MRKKAIAALIYDFDGTLSPGNMQEFGFIQAVGKTAGEFWTMSDEIAKGQDASNVLSYMKLMFDEARRSGIRLERDRFRSFGKDIKLFEGVEQWFSLVNAYGKSIGVTVEHYINSSGLKEIIEGSPIAPEFKHIFAGSFIYDENGEAVWPGIAVDYTAKTQFIFKISKGIFSARDNKRVNASMAEDRKRIPFTNMIYLGDGDTDVPCMKIVGMFGGHSIAVYNPDNPHKKATAGKLRRQGRVSFALPAVYTADSPAFRVVKAILDKIKADHELQLLSL
ncbi:MAG: haloacid dehalogenase-like hydrolase [Bacteroidetes bacterium]|uniref:Haloacid dehalogenase-like hydrolase n=1 Tax=Candidatus Cryptobacteroides avistercoris TaxID=2840758 RepID=A0A9D9IYN3_9BACT|nr:haloacid dehalogenase-like hydrolase [Candidatus Cryptobacteroides avistercoris]